MTLREEIKIEFHCMDALDQYDDAEMYERADRVLKMIEKRIDSISIPEMVNGIYTKPSMEYMAKYMIQQFKEILK